MSHLVGQSLQPIEYIAIAAAVVMFLVGAGLLKQAMYFKFRESIIFSVIFVVFLPITTILFILQHHISPNVFLWALTVNIYTLCYFLLFLHGTLVYFDSIPKRLLLILTIVHVIIFIMNLSTHLYLYDDFVYAKWFGISVYSGGSDHLGSYVPLLVLSNGWVVTGRIYPIFDNLIRVFYIVATIIIYLKVKLPEGLIELKISRSILIIAYIFWAIRPINYLFEIFLRVQIFRDTYTIALPFIGSLLIAYIALNNPVRLMFTKSQIIQARRLYDLIDPDHGEFSPIDSDQAYIKSYLKDLEDIFNRGQISK